MFFSPQLQIFLHPPPHWNSVPPPFPAVSFYFCISFYNSPNVGWGARRAQVHYCRKMHLLPGEIPNTLIGASPHRENSGSFPAASTPALEMGQPEKGGKKVSVGKQPFSG